MDRWMLILLGVIILIITLTIAILHKHRLKSRLHSLTEEHEVHIPHEDTDKVREFIENCWSKGYSIPEIEEILLEKGWSINTIKQMFYKSAVPNIEEKKTRLQKHISTVKQKIIPSKPEKKIVIFKDKKDKPIKITKTVEKNKPLDIPKQKGKLRKKLIKKKKKKRNKKDPEVEDVSESGDTEYRENKNVEELKEELFEDFRD